MRTPLLVAAALTLAVASAPAALAERKYGPAGCGLGAIIFKPHGNQSSASTSNGFGSNQYFAITSGTSNCVPGGKATAAREEEQAEYFVANFATLSTEIAQGGGETVVGLAGVLGCAEAATPSLAAALQDDYEDIFAKPGALAALDAAKDTLRAEPEVEKACLYL